MSRFWQDVTGDEAYTVVVQMENNDARRRVLNGMPLSLLRDIADMQHAVDYPDTASKTACIKGIMREFED